MIVLGLHFGHDASVAIVEDGVIRVCIQAERHTRIKHSLPLTSEHVLLALADCGIEARDVDFCAITTSQPIPYLMVDTEALGLAIDAGQAAAFGLDPRYYLEKCRFYEAAPQQALAKSLARILAGDGNYHSLLAADFNPARPRQKALIPFEELGSLQSWQETLTFEDLRNLELGHLIDSREYRNSFCLPVRVRLFGRDVPGLAFSHHLAHAATAFYLSGFERSAVLTVDGAGDFQDPRTYLGGMYYHGQGHRLVPLAPHRMPAGTFYAMAADVLFGSDRHAGKVMGLAPYGSPRFFDDALATTFPTPPQTWRAKMDWIKGVFALAEVLGYDLGPAGDPAQALAPINADLAATVQRLFETTLVKGAGALFHLLSRLGLTTRNLCLAGGGALNCPTNSLLARSTPFDRLFIPPACDDGGLSVGSALLVTHNVLERPVRSHGGESSRLAFVGRRIEDSDVEKALRAANGLFRVREGNPVAAAAEALANNCVVGCFEGRSEMGPRALGHRSILADPRQAANLDRVNHIKGRETWRPFAPAVLAENCGEWFADCPGLSPFMLFTGRVRSDRIPAVRHVDGSARVQTVAVGDGTLRALLEDFRDRVGVPVLLNTSLNGPGEPICETPEEALAFFRRSGLDAMLMGRYWVGKEDG